MKDDPDPVIQGVFQSLLQRNYVSLVEGSIYEPNPFLSADHLERTLQDIASGEYRDRLSPIFGAPCHVFSVALIWPRDSQDEIVEGELHCRKYQCTSWTKIVLPEVLFLPNMMIGKG